GGHPQDRRGLRSGQCGRRARSGCDVRARGARWRAAPDGEAELGPDPAGVAGPNFAPAGRKASVPRCMPEVGRVVFTVRLRSRDSRSVEAVETDTSAAAEPLTGPEPVPGPVEVSRSWADACLGQLLDNGTVNAKSQCGRCRTMTTGQVFGP